MYNFKVWVSNFKDLGVQIKIFKSMTGNLYVFGYPNQIFLGYFVQPQFVGILIFAHITLANIMMEEHHI